MASVAHGSSEEKSIEEKQEEFGGTIEIVAVFISCLFCCDCDGSPRNVCHGGSHCQQPQQLQLLEVAPTAVSAVLITRRLRVLL